MTSGRLRTFVAIELPDEVRHHIGETIACLRGELGERDHQVRWTNPTGAHLTLQFLGPTAVEAVASVEAAMVSAVAAHRGGRPRLRTTIVGFFPGPRLPRVVWLGLEGDLDRLGAIRDGLEAQIAPLGWPSDTRPFAPHLTLGRLRPQATPAERAGIGRALGQVWAPDPLDFTVDHVSLMLSELGPTGPTYTRLAAVPLPTPS